MKTMQQSQTALKTFFVIKIYFGTLLLMALLLFAALRVAAAPARFNSERQLNDLTQRLNSLDANWGRFQLNGGLTIGAATTFNKDSGNPTLPDFSQQLSLNLDAYIDRNLQFSIYLSHQGGWGFSEQIPNGTIAPMISSPRVDEAFLKFEQVNTLGYLGRFRYSLGPIGLVSDFTVNPAEGLIVQYQRGDLSLAGLYSRVNTVYKNPYTTEISAGDDYLAARLGWSKKNLILGLNLIPNGRTGEKSFSFDLVNNFSQSRIIAELGWYSYHSPEYPEHQIELTPGIILGYSVNPSPQSSWQVKLGYIPPQFQPFYTSLANFSADDREWFQWNYQGIEITQQQSLTRSIGWENRLILLWPVSITDTDQSLSYHWRSSVTKNFSPVNQLELGIDLRLNYGLATQQALLKWNLRF